MRWLYDSEMRWNTSLGKGVLPLVPRLFLGVHGVAEAQTLATCLLE